jgi:quinoprotein dehydrogenase-associated probable ABC transporter substrate-binding protein
MTLKGKMAALAVPLLLLLAGLTARAQEAQAVTVTEPGWELRVCADPASPPFSLADGTGFENRIAAILADELGASLTFDWYKQGPDMINLRLREGECDLIMGVPDGYRELLTTVAYYRSPYVFVYRADAPFTLESFDDPVLHDLRIGLQGTGVPPHDALINRGLQDRISRFYDAYEPSEGSAYLARLVDDVVNGETDVGIAWGPGAGYYAQQQPVALTVVPVAPQIEPPFLPMVFSMTMAMRPGDEALRDRLGIALADRWDEVQALLEEYGVPLASLPRPFVPSHTASEADQPAEAFRLGVVVPTRTGQSLTRAGLYEPVGEAARHGALLAAGEFGAAADREGTRFDVLIASSPTPAAALRAAGRLLATEGVSALTGGFGAGQAEVLAGLADEHGVPFINLGDPDPALRQECSPYVFHLAPSAAMYLDAMAFWFGGLGYGRWFIVHEQGPAGEALADRTAKALAGVAGAAVVGSAAVAHEQPVYIGQIEEAQLADADLIVLLLDPADQIAFLGQLDSLGSDLAVAAFPDPVTQTRDYIAAARQRSGGAGVDYRITPWEATLEGHGATELNDRVLSRWGEPLDPSAWAAYQAVKLLYQAARTAGSQKEALAAYLAGHETEFDLNKGVPLSFRSWDHQLRQPLYAIRIDHEAVWGASATKRLAVADAAGEIPHGFPGNLAVNSVLDLLGDGPSAGTCVR